MSEAPSDAGGRRSVRPVECRRPAHQQAASHPRAVTSSGRRPEQKIEAAVALMIAIGRAMAEDTSEGDLTDFLRNPLIA
jgi:hypothetical protein